MRKARLIGEDPYWIGMGILDEVPGNGVDVVDKNVLDVGAGNGYYLYRAAGRAKIANGLDPFHYAPFHALYAFWNLERPASLAAQVCSQLTPVFDVVMCLGVLYHHSNPIDLYNWQCP